MLPELVHAHARHLLVNESRSRKGIQLLPNQLIASKMVRILLKHS